MRKAISAALVAGLVAAAARPVDAGTFGSRAPLVQAASMETSLGTAPDGTDRVLLPDGSRIIVQKNGLGVRVDASGRVLHAVDVVRPVGYKSAIGDVGPDAVAIAQRLAAQRRRLAMPGEVIVVFRESFDARSLSAALRQRGALGANVAAEPTLASALRAAKARMLQPLFGKLESTRLAEFSHASSRFGTTALSLDKAYRLRIGAGSPEAVARALRASRDVAYAEPNFYVSSLATEPHVIPRHRVERARTMASTLRFHGRELSMRPMSVTPVTLPSNYGLQSSLQSFLNANSIDAVGTYAAFASHSGQLPGQGEIVTNVSLGDLTDASMAQNGDQYVQFYGPTTEIAGKQRYLNIPSFPLIPTFTSDMSGNLNPLGSVEGVDPYLGEVLLDFSVMAPLPDNLQRSGAQGSGLTDLLGIAPGAQYRLVVPEQPTIANIDAALLGAAMQNPKPNVITASLGFGTDTTGFPGRYLEEDPLTEAVIAAIVNHDNTVVCVAANDGTRLYTNAAVNPDGGSTATDVAHGTIAPSSIADDALSTTPGEVPDSGAIAVGGSTLDDIFVAPPEDGGILGGLNAFPETRLDGAINFSSGFGKRVNVSAPSDNIPSMIHQCACGNPTLDPSAVTPVLEGGTSASAPETAAAAAVVLQAARLAGKSLTPVQLRNLLIATGRQLPDPQQLDAKIAVGPQIDLTAAVNALLGSSGTSSAQVIRVAIAQRQELGEIGAEFEENTDPSNIDLAGPVVGLVQTASGQNQFSPITIAPDWYGLPSTAHYALFVTGHAVRPLSTNPWARLMPQTILNAAGQPFVSPSARTVSMTYQALVGNHVLAQATFPLTFGANDGTYLESLAPKVPPVVPAGTNFTVNYDVTGVRGLQGPQLIVGSVGHWNPFTAPYYRIVYSVPITQLKGSAKIPASVLAEGAGIYGVGIEINSAQRVVGRFAPLRVSGSSKARPSAPALSVSPYTPTGHYLAVNRVQPGFTVSYDVSNVRGATGAMLELSAPGPTLSALENVFENAFGSMRDDNGTDTASTVYQPLSGLSGSVTLDAGKLGLTSSLLYNVRVLPVSGGTVVGEASPVSTLEFDDVLAPGGADVSAFDVEPASAGTVSTLSLDGNGNVTESAVYPYQSSNESYGNALVDDTSGANQYYVIGQDAQLGQVGTIVYSPTATGNVQNFVALNATTGAQLANIPLAGGFALALTGRVDGARHRAAVLEYQFGTVGSTIQPVDLTTETAGAVISAGTRAFSRAGQPNAMDLDPSSGLLYLTALNEGTNCVILPSGVETIDLGAATVSPKVSMPTCMAGIASDRAGSSVYLTKGALESIGPGIAPFPSSLVTVQDNPLQLGSTNTLTDRACFMPASDPVAHVTLVGCIAPSDYLINNAAMSVIEVIDQNSKTVLKRIPAFNFAYPAVSGIPYIDRGVQLDPTTRTGWTYSPFGDALQQFSY
jgi:subtilase family protein